MNEFLQVPTVTLQWVAIVATVGAVMAFIQVIDLVSPVKGDADWSEDEEDE